MRTQQMRTMLVLFCLAAVIGACGTPAPSPNQSANSPAPATSGNNGSPSQAPGSATTSPATPSGPAMNNGRHRRNVGKGALGGGMRRRMNGTMPMMRRNRRRMRRTMMNARPISLTTLPTMTALGPFNGGLHAYHEVSTFIPNMGYHWVTAVPGIAFMTNQHNQVTGVEATFPQNLGSFSWYDPPTPPTIPNAGVAFYSEHLYFVPPSSITPSMSPTMPTSLTSWASFVSTNPRLKVYTKAKRTIRGSTVYTPPNGPGIDVLVNASGLVSGFATAEPASWGYRPLYMANNGRPFNSTVLGKAYYSVFLLEPPTGGRGKTT